MKSSLAVVAIGGNSLIKDKTKIAMHDQYEAVKETAVYIADLIENGLDLIITHGNGPQVGFIYRRGELAQHELPLVPLDICGADTQGAIGYMIEKALLNELRKRGVKKEICALVTMALVDRDDPSFKNPTKPIGSFLSREEALANKEKYGWDVVEDAGRGFRRVVPSPIPREIIELDVIRTLVEKGYVLIATGGGGIPVVRNDSGDLEAVEAVIDKDRASSLLATKLGADIFIISTSVDGAYLNFGEKDQTPLGRANLSDIRKYLEEGHFKPGSMKPKIESIIEFLEGGGSRAIITSPENLLEAVKGESGTTIVK
ncbi:MAG: carbamate kinase [Deltaproteobacteria bacterium]|nr:carbamate kinase [Deltaproteobacteria bacterium]MBW2138294.1 carbamate kinase [Deltaproteobacteria bacterium]